MYTVRNPSDEKLINWLALIGSSKNKNRVIIMTKKKEKEEEKKISTKGAAKLIQEINSDLNTPEETRRRIRQINMSTGVHGYCQEVWWDIRERSAVLGFLGTPKFTEEQNIILCVLGVIAGVFVAILTVAWVPMVTKYNPFKISTHYGYT